MSPLLQLFSTTPTEAAALLAAAHDRTAYVLPPEKLAKALTLHRNFTSLHFLREAWDILQLLLILQLGIAARMRDVAQNLSRNRWLQGFTISLELLLFHTLLDLPISLYAHHTLLRFGLSIQSWPSWSLDLLKEQAIFYILGSLGVMLLFTVIRKSPQRGWLWFAAATSACIVAGTFLTPYVFDPLFNSFIPLAQTNPALVVQLEKIVARAPAIDIPPSRIFLMKASEKVTTANAYVTGLGASKRVVVWDTSLTGPPEDLLATFAHEIGHYVLHHVVIGLSLTNIFIPLEFWIGFRLAKQLLARFGKRWRISSQQDWAALAVFLLILSTLDTLTEPLANSISRQIEHNADVYGQEALHGIVPYPAQATQASFQRLGEQSLDVPNPNALIEFWTYTHSSISRRAAFAHYYHPWTPTTTPKYFGK